MRDLVVLAALLALLPLALMRLHLATLLWTWISLMAPHRLTYGFIYSAPINKLIAIVSIISVLVSPDKKRLPGGALMWLLLSFFAWTTVTTFLGGTYPEQGVPDYFVHIFPVFIHIVLVMLCINSKDRLHAFIWIIIISLGFHGAKMGLVTIIEGGSPTSKAAYGPLGTLIQDRNHFALAIVMIFPILFYLYSISQPRFLRLMILGVGALSIISVLGSFSRGGLVALIAMGGALWWRSKRKVFIAMGIAVIAFGAVMLSPADFKERMATITEQFKPSASRFEEKELDLSFAQRLSVWRMGWKMMREDPLTGHGLRAIQHPETGVRFAVTTDPLYGTIYYKQRAAHNIYIQVGSDSGFIGLGLFLAMLGMAMLTCQWMMRQTRDVPELHAIHSLARLMPVSLVGYAVGGASLSMAYYDGFYMILLIIVCMRRLVLEHQGRAIPRHTVGEKEYRLKKRMAQQAEIA